MGWDSPCASIVGLVICCSRFPAQLVGSSRQPICTKTNRFITSCFILKVLFFVPRRSTGVILAGMHLRNGCQMFPDGESELIQPSFNFVCADRMFLLDEFLFGADALRRCDPDQSAEADQAVGDIEPDGFHGILNPRPICAESREGRNQPSLDLPAFVQGRLPYDRCLYPGIPRVVKHGLPIEHTGIVQLG